MHTAVSVSTTNSYVGSLIILSATCASGISTNWYAVATDETALGTGASFIYALPLGVSQSFYAACKTTSCKSGRTVTSNSVTVSGTPTQSGTFNYKITLTGGCETVTAMGITVNPAIILICPVNTNTVACQTQATVNTAFTAWLATASASGSF